MTGRIEYDHVSFAHPDSGPVLDDIELEIPAGHRQALVGSTGAGKSTLLRLVPRFIDPTAGSVRLDGVDLRDLDLEWLRRHVALVPQELALLRPTVWENVVYGSPWTSRTDAVAAARAVGVHDVLAGLRDGYDTEVGEGGSGLSGGQRQCVAVARAMARDAKVLLLDEPTTGLDAATQSVVVGALDRLSEGRTTLIVSHQLNAVHGADRISVISHGRMIEHGTHHELVSGRSAYRESVRGRVLLGDHPSGHAGSRGERTATNPRRVRCPPGVNAPMHRIPSSDLEKEHSMRHPTAPDSEVPAPARLHVCVVGAGYVGLTAAACLARLGHRVRCVEVDEQRLSLIQRGVMPIHEPGLAELVAAGRASGDLEFHARIAPALEGAEVALLCVGTPPQPSGEPDLRFLAAAARQLARSATADLIVVVKSTVPPGSCEALELVCAEEAAPGLRIRVASSPEFLRESRAVEDFLAPDRVVVGAADDDVADVVVRLYPTGAPVIRCDRRGAELVKYRVEHLPGGQGLVRQRGGAPV